jgi:quercetin dioxygenase-like cupin family protein
MPRSDSSPSPISSSQHCDVYQAPGSSTALECGAGLLDGLVAPISTTTFRSKYFRRKCFLALGGGIKRFNKILSELFHDGDVEALAENTASESIHVWMRQHNPGASAAAGASSPTTPTNTTPTLDSIRVDSAKDAMVCYAAGASLYFRSPQAAADALLPSVAEALGMGAGVGYFDHLQQDPKGEIEVFATRAGHKTGWHFDFMENFTLQISGKKKWTLRMGDTHSVLRGATPHYKTTPDVQEMQVRVGRLSERHFSFSPNPATFFKKGEVTEVLLSPGDILYFPAGCWHQVECIEDSVSANLSLVGTTWADIAGRAIKTSLYRDDEWRQIVAMDGKSFTRSHEKKDEASGKTKEAPTSRGKKRLLAPGGGTTSAAAPPSSTSSPFPAIEHLDDVYKTAEKMLERLRAHVASLRPEHLLPPAAFLSRRFDGLKGGDFPISGQEDEQGEDEEDEQDDDDDDDDNDDREDADGGDSHSDGGVAGRGVRVHFEHGQLVLTVAKENKDSIGSDDDEDNEDAKEEAIVMSPVAIVARAADVGEEDSEADSSSFSSYVVCVNFGSDDLSSLYRTIIRVPSSLSFAMDQVCGASSGPPNMASAGAKALMPSFSFNELRDMVGDAPLKKARAGKVAARGGMKQGSSTRKVVEVVSARTVEGLMNSLVFAGAATFM